MTFRDAFNGGNCLNCEWIAAEGAITKATPGAFAAFIGGSGQASTGSHRTVVFNSPGGDLAAAMALGRLIRTRGFSTGIGATVQDEYGSGSASKLAAGRCESACAFAFMGGAARSARDRAAATAGAGSKLGVHQFFRRTGRDIPSSATQQILGQLLLFVLDMGISPDVLSIASRTPADRMYYFSDQELGAFGLDTQTRRTEATLVVERDGLALNWDILDATGAVDRQAHLYCDLRYGAWLLRIVHFLGGSPEVDREFLRSMYFRVNDTRHPLSEAFIIDIRTVGAALAMTVRLPVDLRRHAGQTFRFRSTEVRVAAGLFAADGTVPQASTLALLSRACVRS